mgnify:CR=1 FL=1
MVCYDVTDDNRRGKLARWLDGFGDRVQYSVFECVLEDRDRIRMMAGVDERIERNEDRVSVYCLCRRCESGVQHLGNAGSGPRPGQETVWVV